MLLPPPSGCADNFSPGHTDCVPGTTQLQCLHSKAAQFCLNLALPCAQPSHLASPLPQMSSPVTPKWILPCTESEEVKAILSPGQRCLYLKQDGFFQHQELILTGNAGAISKVIPGFPGPYLTLQGH